MIETVNLTPTPEACAHMARLFARAVVDDAQAYRRHATGLLLGSLVELVAQLARVQSDAELLTLVTAIKADADRPAERCAADLPWARTSCSNMADGPDGCCEDCRAALAEGGA